MFCECKELPRIFNYERYRNNLKSRLAEVDSKDGNWLKLNKCCICGQHWQIDVWDKYHTVCALKIDKPENWQNYNDKADRLMLLIETRGGLSEEKCIKQDCLNKALKTLAYCPMHAYKISLRE